MSIDPGTLNKRITLLRPELVDNGLQTVTECVADRAIWADVQYVSDREKYAAGAVGVDTELRVIVRYRAIEHDWQFDFKSIRYEIIGIAPSSKDESYLQLTAKRVK